MQFYTDLHARFKKRPLRWIAIIIALLLLTGCAPEPQRQPAAEKASAKSFQVPRRSDPLTPEQEAVRQQATSAVEADIDGYLGRYIEMMTTERDASVRVVKPGTRDMVAAGQADIGLSNLSMTLQRAQKIKFTDPYRQLGIVLLLNRMKMAANKLTAGMQDPI